MPTVELDHRLVNTEVLPRFVNLSKPRVGEVDHVPDLVKWIISRLGAVSYHRGIIYNVDITIQSPVTVPRHNSGQITVPEIFLGTPDVVHLPTYARISGTLVSVHGLRCAEPVPAAAARTAAARTRAA